MPVYDTPNSSSSDSLPSDAVYLDFLVIGGTGGNGGDGGYDTSSPGSGGAAGEVSGRYPVSGGESITAYVGEPGEDGTSNGVGGAGGQSPVADAGDGGGGTGTSSDDPFASGDGGGGGSVSAIDVDGTPIAYGEGGGGGGGNGDNANGTYHAGGGGGGGARGGAGGTTRTSGDYAGEAGSDAGDSGSGGAGGDGGDGPDDATDGADGGALAHPNAIQVSTSTSTNAPAVVTDPIVLKPPSNLQTTAVGTTTISLSWDLAADDREGVRVLWRYSDESEWTFSSDDLDRSTTTYEITGLLHGQEYDVAVETFIGEKTRLDTT